MFGSDTALIITMSGLLIVFSVLVLLVAIIKLFGVIFNRGSNKKATQKEESADALKPAKTVTPDQNTTALQEDDEILAVISAAVYAYCESTNKNYRIHSIRPASTGRARPAWANAGIIQNTRPF